MKNEKDGYDDDDDDDDDDVDDDNDDDNDDDFDGCCWYNDDDYGNDKGNDADSYDGGYHKSDKLDVDNDSSLLIDLLFLWLQGAEFEVYETYAREQTALASKLYRHLGIGGKLYELLARPSVADYFKVWYNTVYMNIEQTILNSFFNSLPN